jgi:branched-chain amino acid aminotransferase
MNYTLLNGSFLPSEQAMVHVSDLSIHRGYGIFDFFRVVNNVPLFLSDYLDRFISSAREAHLPMEFAKAALAVGVEELIQRNQMPNSGIKMILTGGYSPDGFHIGNPNLIITQQPLHLPPQPLSHPGIKVITYPYRRDLPQIKSINYMMGIWVQQRMQEQGAMDVLYQMGGEISEFPRCNFFMVDKEGVIVTPDRHILPGVTRKNVLRLAESRYSVREGEVRMEDLPQACEAFLTSTTKRIIPVVQVDDWIIGDGKPGPITLDLLARLLEMEEREIGV